MRARNVKSTDCTVRVLGHIMRVGQSPTFAGVTVQSIPRTKCPPDIHGDRSEPQTKVCHFQGGYSVYICRRSSRSSSSSNKMLCLSVCASRSLATSSTFVATAFISLVLRLQCTLKKNLQIVNYTMCKDIEYFLTQCTTVTVEREVKLLIHTLIAVCRDIP